jgi:TolA-binding protein
MNETQLKKLLTGADQACRTESSTDSAAMVKSIRRQYAIRMRHRTEWLAAGTLGLLAAAWLAGYNQYSHRQEQKQIALQTEIQKKIADLKAEAEQTLTLIKSANQQTQKRKQLAQLQQRLASITAQSARTENTDEQLAGELYQMAQSLSAQADSCSAVKILYQQIIRTFPNSSYTQDAKAKMTQLDCPNGIHL